MPSFCRHSRLIQNCPICSKEQAIELRPVISSSAPKASLPRVSSPRPAGGAGRGATRGAVDGSRSRGGGRQSAGGLTVRRLARGVDDGYQSSLVPGLKSSADAERLADELAFAARRLEVMESAPVGLWAEIAAAGDIEERTWLAFLISYLGPIEGDEPFSAIEAVRTTWASGQDPRLDDVVTGARGAHLPDRGSVTMDAYRAWAARAGSQEAAFAGEQSWTPERRFARVFERMALPGMHRDARFELLVTLGRLSVYELRAGALQLGGDNEVTVAAKRALGIGDPMLLERRAADLAEACELPLDTLDLGFHNWGSGQRTDGGLVPGIDGDPDVAERARAALGL